MSTEKQKKYELCNINCSNYNLLSAIIEKRLSNSVSHVAKNVKDEYSSYSKSQMGSGSAPAARHK